MKKVSRKQIKKGSKPWITRGIKTSIKKRDKLLKSFIKENDLNIKTNLHNQYKFYRNQIVKLTRVSKTNHYKNYFNANINKSKNIWKGVNELIKIDKTRKKDTISLNIDGSISTDPEKVSDELNKHFTTIAGKIRNNIRNNHGNNFKRTLKDSSLNSFFFKRIKSSEMIKIINTLKPKANGPFSIPPTILKTILADIAEILSKLFNLSFQSGVFFSSLKIAKVIPIYKNKGSANDVNNYRPISLLSNIDKIFEKLIHLKLVKFLDLSSTIFKNQFGFRSKHSITHALINLTEKIRTNIDNGLYSCGVFIDLH